METLANRIGEPVGNGSFKCKKCEGLSIFETTPVENRWLPCLRCVNCSNTIWLPLSILGESRKRLRTIEKAKDGLIESEIDKRTGINGYEWEV